MIRVHVWNFLGSSQAWGHASLHINHEYISWWPGGENRHPKLTNGVPVYSVAHIQGQTYKDDQHLEARDPKGEIPQPPDHTIPLNGLDEKRILTWWKMYSRPGRPWTTLGQNCSTTVARAMALGGGDDYSEGFGGWWASWNTIWTPADVLRYAQAIARGLRTAGSRPFAINFVRRFCTSPLGFTSVTLSMDEEGLANALYKEHGSEAAKVHAVFKELNENRNSDADDVAEIYVRLLMKHKGHALDVVKHNPKLRDLLAEVMKKGWTTAGEQECIDFLKNLK